MDKNTDLKGKLIELLDDKVPAVYMHQGMDKERVSEYADMVIELFDKLKQDG